jgi:ribokinase
MKPISSKQVVVFGSLNMDLMIKTPRMPTNGETLQGHSIQYLPGGKGGNQAVSCTRLGAQVRMLGQVGADTNGAILINALDMNGIDHSGVLQDPLVSTGVALVMVDDAAQNRIVVIAGANGTVQFSEAYLTAQLAQASFLVMQLELPLAQVHLAAQVAQRLGCRVVLNPSPVQPLPDALWPLIDTLIVNEVEAQAFSHLSVDSPTSAATAARALLARGPARVVVTLGAMGAVAADTHGCSFHPALDVKAVDTTAAGDTFLGAVVVTLSQGGTLDEGVALGILAASLCVQRNGAQASIPARSELSPHRHSLTGPGYEKNHFAER